MVLGLASHNYKPGSIATQTLLIATWFGLVTGISEGLLALVLPHFGWLSWRVLRAISPEIFWITPVVDLMLFGSLALLILAMRLFLGRLPVVRLVVFLSAFLMFFDWLTLSGHARGKFFMESALGLVAAGAALL